MTANINDIVDMDMINFLFHVLPEKACEWLLNKIGDTSVNRKLLDSDDGRRAIIRESLTKEHDHIERRKDIITTLRLAIETKMDGIMNKLDRISAIGSNCYKCKHLLFCGSDIIQVVECYPDDEFGMFGRKLSIDDVNGSQDNCKFFYPMSQEKCVFCDGTELHKQSILPYNVVLTGYICLKCKRYFYFSKNKVVEWKQ